MGKYARAQEDQKKILRAVQEKLGPYPTLKEMLDCLTSPDGLQTDVQLIWKKDSIEPFATDIAMIVDDVVSLAFNRDPEDVNAYQDIPTAILDSYFPDH